MSPDLKKMEAQFTAWGLEIDHLMVIAKRPGARARFDSVMHVDELKALHVIARTKLDDFKAGETGDQAHLKDELERAWRELAAAFEKPMP